MSDNLIDNPHDTPSKRQRMSNENSSRSEQEEVNSSSFPATLVVLTPQRVLDTNDNTLTDYEKSEIMHHESIYYYGQYAPNKPGCFRDSNGHYTCISKDHLEYRYEIVKFLIKGVYANVILAYDHKEKTLVVIKILQVGKFITDFSREIEILRKLQCLNLSESEYPFVRLLRSFDFRGHTFLVFQRLNYDLFDAINTNNGGFSGEFIRSMTYNIVKSLYLLNKHDIVHCDLKPENIMFLREGHQLSVKLIDFGLSRYTGNMKCGPLQTLHYCAPETILKCLLGAPVDMWSLACVIAELHTGNVLFQGDDENDQLSLFVEMLGIPSAKAQADAPKLIKLNNHSSDKRGMPGTRDLQTAMTRDPRETPDPDMVHFVERCLDWNPQTRLTPVAALEHPFLKKRIPQILINSYKMPIFARIFSENKRRSDRPDTVSAVECFGYHFTTPF